MNTPSTPKFPCSLAPAPVPNNHWSAPVTIDWLYHSTYFQLGIALSTSLYINHFILTTQMRKLKHR